MRVLLKKHPQFLNALNHAVKIGGDLMLYGCDLAQGQDGEDFLEIIKGNSHVDLAASNDVTGNIGFGGDWELEIQKGNIETTPLANSIALNDFTELLQVTFSMNAAQVVVYGGICGASYNAQVRDNSNTHTLTFDGAIEGTSAAGYYAYAGAYRRIHWPYLR